ncbi:DUF4158 domain-containing protein [Streptomyces sp. NBC_01381]|nr:DUF4158 domain-containing protein [Streptomyces sp. NBC_01381]MCX4672521.1 DUF4158 domain-containing protein [Streptomyces sp. NBC_01381]
MARTSLDLDELVEHWTLLKDEQVLVSGKRGAMRLGFAVLLKFHTQYGRFPRNRAELPGEAVEFVARQVQVPASELESYDWTGRTVEYHRAQIRGHLGFRECSVADAKLTAYVAEHVAHKERRPEQVRVEPLARCRAESIEPPTSGRCDRIVGAALRAAEESLTAQISSRLTVESIERIVARATGADQDDAGPAGGGAEGEDAPPVLTKAKEAPGNVSLETMLTEIDKLLAVRAIGLPRDLFIDVAPKAVAGWRARAAVESPSHLRTHPVALRVTLLAALLHEREREITDTLVELLISTVHRIGARAEKKVTEQLINAFKNVSGKENILFKLAKTSLGTPEGNVRQVVFPAVSGGEATLRGLVHEFKTRGPVYRRTVQTTLKASYTNHYRRGLIKLLDVLEFRSSNHAHRPVIEALALVARYANAGNTTYYPLGETPPVHKAMGGDWVEVVHRADKRGRRRVVALALRRPWGAHLLARGEEVAGHPLPADQLHRVRGRRDDRGRDAARNHDGRGGQLHGLAWPVGNRVRHHETAQLRPAAAYQADQQGQAVPGRGRRAGCLPTADPGADPRDPLGTHRPAVRPDDQVRHGDPYPQRFPPHLRGDAGSRPCPEDHLRGPLPAAAGPSTGDRGGPERHGGLQRRQLCDRLRQGRGDRLQPA